MTRKANELISSDLTPLVDCNIGHTNSVTGVTFTPDSKQFASFGFDGTLILWNTDNGKIVRKIQNANPDFWWEYFSSCGTYAICSEYDITEVWNVITGELEAVLDETIYNLIVSPKGKFYVTSNSDKKMFDLLIKNYPTQQIISRIGLSSTYSVKALFSFDAAKLVVSLDDKIFIYDTNTGDCICELDIPTELYPDVDKGSISFEDLSISRDGTLLSGKTYSDLMGIWNTETGKFLHLIEYNNDPMCSAFSPDGKVLAVGSVTGNIDYYDTDSFKILHHIDSAHNGWLRVIRFSPSGKYIVTGDDDKILRLWDANSYELLISMGDEGYSVDFLSFEKDGRTLISENSDGTRHLWDVQSLSLINTIKSESHIQKQTNTDDYTPYAISPDGNLIASGNPSSTAINLLQKESNKLIHSLHIINKDTIWELVYSVVFSGDGKMIAIGHDGFMVSLWDTETGNLIGIIKTRRDSVSAIAFSPDSKTLAAGTDYDSVIQLFSIKTLKEKRRLIGHTNNVNTLAFSPDGKLLASGSSDGSIKLWNPKTGALIATLRIPCQV